MAITILLADDLEFIKMVEKEALEKKGFEVIGDAIDGEEAIKKYNELKPDVVVMDITMPKMDGLDSMKAILKADSKARIVICSAMGQHQIIVDAIKNGARDFVVKPFKFERLISAIEKATTDVEMAKKYGLKGNVS